MESAKKDFIGVNRSKHEQGEGLQSARSSAGSV